MRKFIGILNVLFFIGMVTVNALAWALPINGQNTGQISALYPNQFTPADLTFSIWGVIYILLFIYVIYQLRMAFSASKIQGTVIERIGPWFIVSCLLNGAWLFAWHYQYVLYSLILMCLLFLSLMIIYIRLEVGVYHPAKQVMFRVDLPFSVYFGWVSVALIANVTVYLVSIDWDGFGIDPVWWASALVVLAGLIGVIMLTKRNDVFYAATILWALVGIYLNQYNPVDRSPVLYFTLITVMAILVMNLLVKLIRRRIY